MYKTPTAAQSPLVKARWHADRCLWKIQCALRAVRAVRAVRACCESFSYIYARPQTHLVYSLGGYRFVYLSIICPDSVRMNLNTVAHCCFKLATQAGWWKAAVILRGGGGGRIGVVWLGFGLVSRQGFIVRVMLAS